MLSVLDSGTKHAGHAVPTLVKAACAAAMLLWGNIIKVQLLDVWSFGTDLSHVVVI